MRALCSTHVFDQTTPQLFTTLLAVQICSPCFSASHVTRVLRNMAIGTMGPDGSNGKTGGGDGRIAIGSLQEAEGRQLDEERPLQEDDVDEERNEDSVSSNSSPQSLDDEAATCSGVAQDKTSNGSAEESRLNDFAQNEQKDEPFVWTPYAEVHLLNALRGLRPVGANFNFQINIIHGRFEAGMGTYISREDLVKKLYTWYNFDEALRICGGEDIPTNESNFSLPEDEFPECATRKSKLVQKSSGDRK
ncbi:uncharacterized protein isoform X2 [Rhodnius prolixus]|uniref:uncharacterized protein isoform X2 n=1 Tax=Rhodnius prolixus TaxID=13249 RepID=UPI003D18B3FE